MLRADPVYVRRTGDAPLRLDGPSLAAHVSTRTAQGPAESRWHEISVWEAESLGLGRLCLQVEYRSQWQGELGHDWAVVIDRPALRETLRAHDALAYVRGYPPTPSYAERQARLLAELGARWEHAVSDVLELMQVWDT
jgi:hypothetical protein